MMKYRYPDFNIPMQMRKTLLPLLIVFSFFSCQKELSIENGGTVNNPDPDNPAIGFNCRVQQILAVDSLTGKGLLSVFTSFKNNGMADRVTIYDSISSTVEFTAGFTFSPLADTIYVSPTDYFAVDNNRRVNSFTTIDYTGNTLDTLTYRYEYDANGYLKEKTLYVSSLPVPVIRFSYVWSGGNLVSVSGNTAIVGLTQKVLEANMEYNSSATAKNFLPVYPDGFESSLFLMALNLGKPSTNLIRKMTIKTYDDNGQLDETLVSEYKNYKFSSDGYLTEWYISGDLLGGSPFVEGRSKFKYFCL
jgi:hypothetical protein